MLRLEEAQEIVLANVGPRPTAEVETLGSLGGTLAEDLRADRDQPPFDKSMMDGFAVRSGDAGAPTSLSLLPHVGAAGMWPAFELKEGQAAKILTGAPLPRGADAVVKIEDTRVDGDRITLGHGVAAGENVAARGEDIRQGDVAVARGTRITPPVLGLIGTVGRQSVRIFQPPSVAVLTTGNEVVEFNEAPGASQIRNSNSLTLLGLLWRHGIEGHYRGIVRDDLEMTRKALIEALDCDLVLVTGGASIGEFDLVGAALDGIGARVLFDGVAIKPGKPVTFARHGERAIFSLPGNPVSAAVAFHLLVDPYLRKLMGSTRPLPAVYQASLAERFRKKGPRRHFVPSICIRGENGVEVRPAASHGSGDLVAFATANCLMVAPEGEVAWEVGAVVEVLPLEDARA